MYNEKIRESITGDKCIIFLIGILYNLIATVGNFNSETGLPLSVFNIRKEHEAALFEMGMNRENEIGEIAKEIGRAHV